jgi:hypothetical protein
MVEMFRLGCRSVRRELWDYAGERLSEGPMEQVERHLNRCASCRQEVRAMRESQKLLSVCREETPPSRAGWSDLRSRLVAEGLAERETVGSGWRSESRLVRMPELGSTSPRLGWLPRLGMASGFAAFLMMAAITYRTTLPQNRQATDPPMKDITQGGLLAADAGSGSRSIYPGPGNEPININHDGPSRLPTTIDPGVEKPNSSKIVNHDPRKTEVDDAKDTDGSKLRKEYRPKRKTDSDEYRLKPNPQGKMRFVPEKNNGMRIAGPPQSSPPMRSDSSGYDLGGDGYTMGTLTPVSHEEGAF